MTDISSTIDGLFFGYVVTLVLLGIIVVQIWTYLHNNDDGWALRTFIIVLALLDITETICTTQLVYHYLISHFGDINALKSHWSLISVDFTITNTTYFLAHLFFAHRLWRLRKSCVIPIMITFTSTTMLALGLSIVIEQNLGRLTFSDYQRHYIMIEMAMLHALAITTDILITLGLSWTLSTAYASFKTRTVLQRLLVFSVTRGILICFAQTGHILMYFLNSTNLLFWISLHLVLGKLYVLTTLFTLNTRSSLRDKLGEVNSVTLPISFGHSDQSRTNDIREEARYSPEHTRENLVPFHASDSINSG
ncbi:hypothetical protein BDZ94DRAFT_530684 [Collybia nuda]|uniref:DUF6534 domain-containing protein n=1 Tax=Collybia nuda TaxID=64659 RepID=A0A9P5XQG1_9AGAR|nr:hypothetical protein BDZ94DRAFT_530684 [Collybia nuda]